MDSLQKISCFAVYLAKSGQGVCLDTTIFTLKTPRHEEKRFKIAIFVPLRLGGKINFKVLRQSPRRAGMTNCKSFLTEFSKQLIKIPCCLRRGYSFHYYPKFGNITPLISHISYSYMNLILKSPECFSEFAM